MGAFMIRRCARIHAALLLTMVLAAQAQQAPSSRSADRSRQDERTIVIPAGTQIKVDVSEENPPRNVARTYTGKVIVPVQAESTVVIPALSKVTIGVSVGPPYGEVRELIQVTLDSGSYDLHTDLVPTPPGSVSETVFTLAKDVKIKR